MSDHILTCVYCGMEYPEGTPPHGSDILTEHIKICEKHPMRQAEQKIKVLREALIGLIGAETKEELEQMDAILRITPGPNGDKLSALNAIHALQITA